VHPGVGSSGAIHPDADSPIEAGEDRFELPLDRPFPRLDLEAGKVRTVVFNPRAKAHEGFLSKAGSPG